MAKKKSKTKRTKKPSTKQSSFKLTSQHKLIIGSLFIILGILFFVSFVSFIFTGKEDQSIISQFPTRSDEAQNWARLLGAQVSDLFITKGFGIASFIFSGLIFLSGIYVALDLNKSKLFKHWIWGILIVIWLSIFFGFFTHKYDVLGGVIGYEMNMLLQDYVGKIGTSLLLLFGLIIYLAIRFNVTAQSLVSVFKSAKSTITNDLKEVEEATFSVDNSFSEEAVSIKSAYELPVENLEPT
ncbi:MAG: DNA translocase FtsK 4TM domain-containing protein, partial [Winogradskyella sp.]|nr:DNA translocase FtsK 4TM domain-containing protein [Winogradskyella sp.]